MDEKKIVWYTDERTEDFASTRDKIRVEPVTEDYPYHRPDPVWHVLSFLVHRVFAVVVLFPFMKLGMGMRIRNRKALRKIRSGFFLYGNHTQDIADAYLPTFTGFPRKVNILVGDAAVSIPFVKHLVPLLGGIPLPSTVHAYKPFLQEMERRIRRHQAVAVFPEAHIWPWYNGIRDYPDTSFAYPFRFNVPAVGFVVTYRQRKIFRNGKPLVTVTLSDPIYPSDCSGRRDMRDRVYSFMRDTAEKEHSYAYIEYRKKEG